MSDIAELQEKITETQEMITGYYLDELNEAEEALEDWTEDPERFDGSFREILDVDGSISINGSTFLPSQILYDLDTDGYNQGLADYAGDLLEAEKNKLVEAVHDAQRELDDEKETLAELIEELKN